MTQEFAEKYTLGLDLGPNSIGWAIVLDTNNPANSRLIDAGVRVFPEGVDAFDTSKEVSRSETRRVARGMRRQTQRRVRRRRELRSALMSIGLWPERPEEHTKLLQLDPYALRASALSKKLEPFELGRVFLHLGQRRGFLSNRKTDKADSELKGLLAEINQNEAERVASGHDTLGQWLAAKQAAIDHADRKENDHVRRRHLARRQYLEEFEAIWAAQSKHYPSLLGEALKNGTASHLDYPCEPRVRPEKQTLLQAYGLFGLLFFQRKMYWPASVVGKCELEPKQKRCPRADRRAERFRLLQEVNNLRIIDPEARDELPLNEEQRTLLLAKLARTEKMTFDQIRKALGFLESIRFNLERGSRSQLKGAVVDAMMASAKVLGKSWHDRPEQEKNAIVSMLANPDANDAAFLERAAKDWNLTREAAEKLLGLDLPSGYMNVSLMALQKLLPHMERGLVYMADDEKKSALHAAGYLRRDQLKRRLFDRLPDPRRTKDSPIGDIPNPVVKRTLTEVRKVVNAILREYGKPKEVHIEMARSLQMSSMKRKEYSKQIRDKEEVRSSAAEKIRELGYRATRENILRYQLWKEQREECIYSGKAIGVQQLFGEAGGIEIDHILPRSRTLDDSQMNKIICFRDSNSGKGDRTPFEWLVAEKPQQYEKVCQRAKELAYPKYRRFLLKELELDKFIARQLTDTAYITKATAEYIKCLFEKDHAVLGLKGQLTAELRWHWGLETVLEELPDSPAWQEKNNLRPGEKNRADHRHHSIDAIVIALTNRSRLHRLSEIVRKGGAQKHGEILDDPWDGFRNDVVSRMKTMNVSHRAERKVSGALHEETVYGKTEKPGEWVARKPVESLSPSEIERIRDQSIRDIVISRLKQAGIEFGRGKSKPDPKKMKEALANLTMPSGVPIKKVRVTKSEQTIQPIRKGENTAYVKPGSMHHLCIFEWEHKGKKKRGAVFVSMLEAMNRVKWKEPLIKRTPPTDDATIPANARFVMSLSGREMLSAEHKGVPKLVYFKTAASTSGQMWFALHTDARRSGDQPILSFSPDTLLGKKVTVDPLGRIRWAND